MGKPAGVWCVCVGARGAEPTGGFMFAFAWMFAYTRARVFVCVRGAIDCVLMKRER